MESFERFLSGLGSELSFGKTKAAWDAFKILVISLFACLYTHLKHFISEAISSKHSFYPLGEHYLPRSQKNFSNWLRILSNHRYADDTTLMAESEELKSLLTKVKEEREKVGLKLNIQKTKIIASGLITSWEIDGETVETVTDFIFGAPESLQMVITAMKLKDACSLEDKLWPT